MIKLEKAPQIYDFFCEGIKMEEIYYHCTGNIQQFLQVLGKYSKIQKFPKIKILSFFIFLTVALINDASSQSYGSPASVSQYKFAAALYVNGIRECNAAIISELYVMTAAHCIHNKRKTDMRVLVGRNSQSPVWREVERLHLVNGWNHCDFANDIGIIQLKESLVYDTYIQPIEYQTVVSPAAFMNCTLVRLRDEVTDSVLRTVQSLWAQNVAITSHKDCKELYSNVHVNHRCIVSPYECVPGPHPRDSGAAIICRGKLTAILSTGIEMTRMATQVAMVAPHESWIGDTIYSSQIETKKIP